MSSNSNIVITSFAVSSFILKGRKSFCNGDYIQDLMLETPPFLIEDFVNKDKNKQCIKDLPIIKNTLKDWVLINAKNMINQQITDFKLCNLFSICFDKSTDITVSFIFIRYFVKK